MPVPTTIPIYAFGLDIPNDPSISDSPESLGGKGSGLAWMHKQGLPVPPGFVIPTEVWAQYKAAPKTTMKAIGKAIVPYLSAIRKHFGHTQLLSVRSGARVSCPGMMDTILNVGLDAQTYPEWEQRLGVQCAQNSYQRLITMYGSVVDRLHRQEIEQLDLIDALAYYYRKTGHEFPGRSEQLLGSIEAVFKSWNNERAKTYRKMNGIPEQWGTAVTVQAMVFGNLNEKSGTGVLFTRNPDTGENTVIGEFLKQAQGEDVVAGIRTPDPLTHLKSWNPAVFDELIATVAKLEELKRDVQDVEFTVQDGKLYLLQTRSAKRSATAAVRIALDMWEEKLITAKRAASRVTAKQYDLAQQRVVDPKWSKPAAVTGISACSGMAYGVLVYSSEEAVKSKVPCILVTEETTPDDIAGMYAARGIVTMTGGATSHAAVVARGMNKPCIVGVGWAINFKLRNWLSMDGGSGRIWFEEVPTVGGSDTKMIRDFRALVMQAHDVLPVLTEAPKELVEQALIHLGEGVYDTASALGRITEAKEKVKFLYLDLAAKQSAAGDAYRAILAGYNPEQALVASLEKYYGPKIDVTDIIVIGDVQTKFKKLEGGADLRALILAEDEIVLDGLASTDPAVVKVINWKHASGVNYISLGSVLEGSKSFMTVEQVIALSGK